MIKKQPSVILARGLAPLDSHPLIGYAGGCRQFANYGRMIRIMLAMPLKSENIQKLQKDFWGGFENEELEENEW